MAWERSGVPGGSTRTSWFGRDVPAMWRLLENQQSNDHWRLVAGWRKASELTAAHLRRLEHYRTNLADVWPPDRNAAAAAYVARLDFLIQNVRTTHEVAAANYSTLAATVGALAAARQDLKPLHDEYVAKSRAIKDHANLTALNAAAEAPTVIGAAPAGPQDLERLNNRARAIMYSLSHTLIEAEAAIRQPPTYQPMTHWDQGVPDIYGNGRRQPSAWLATTPRASVQQRSKGIREGDGTHSSTMPSADPADRVTPVIPTSIAPDASPRTSRSSTSIEVHRRLTQSPGHAERLPLSRAQVIPSLPGGIIGAVPAVEGPSNERIPIRVNPVGGTIEAQRVQELAANRSSAVPPFMGGVARDSVGRKEKQVTSGFSDTTWETASGVPPVIEPRRVTEHDPGPAIGLDP
jgi:hypothetical protein